MDIRQQLISEQSAWAASCGLDVDERGYLTSIEANLWRPLSTRTLRAYTDADGSELLPSQGRLPKMSALHSSSALAANVFDYWTARDPSPIAKALGFRSSALSLDLEVKFRTGLRGKAPNVDLVLALESGITVAIESKFCEWLAPKRPKQVPFKQKYFSSPRMWTKLGLPACQALAESIHRGGEWFWYLDAPQLLKHALGLATQLGDRFSLCYLYYDPDGPQREEHRAEIASFAAQVGAELRFKAMTYQDLFARLRRSAAPADAAYIQYLSERYFPPAAEPYQSF